MIILGYKRQYVRLFCRGRRNLFGIMSGNWIQAGSVGWAQILYHQRDSDFSHRLS